MKNIIIIAVIMAMVIGCNGNEHTKIVPSPVPIVYVSTPVSMLDADGITSKRYAYNQDIVLNAEIYDDQCINDDNVKWILVSEGVHSMLGTGTTLRVKGGTIEAGSHKIGVFYTDSDDNVGTFDYYINVDSAPPVRTVIKASKSVLKTWDGYVNNGDETVTHISTGLTWMTVDDGYDRTYSEAVKYAKKLSSETGKTWYIPTLTEWTKVANLGKGNSHVIDEPFQELKSGAKYWTRSAPKHSPTVGGKRVAYTVEVSSIVGGGLHMRTKEGIASLDSACYVILVTKG
jgi:hypothetical protein